MAVRKNSKRRKHKASNWKLIFALLAAATLFGMLARTTQGRASIAELLTTTSSTLVQHVK